jgi:hypothetical protein
VDDAVVGRLDEADEPVMVPKRNADGVSAKPLLNGNFG